MKYTIILNSVEDAYSFVDKVEKYDCDVELISGRFHIDAKSLLKLLARHPQKNADVSPGYAMRRNQVIYRGL